MVMHYMMALTRRDSSAAVVPLSVVCGQQYRITYRRTMQPSYETATALYAAAALRCYAPGDWCDNVESSPGYFSTLRRQHIS